MSLDRHALRHFRARNRRRRARTEGGTFHDRKDARRAFYLACVHGWVRKTCVACNGSGHYDNDGAPPCGACAGKGWDYEPGPKALGREAT